MKSNIWSVSGKDPQDLGAEVIDIEGLAGGGRGVGRVGGKVWLVDGGLPGDRVRARAVSDRGRYVEARAEAILTPGPERRAAPCPIQGACGGCPWMPLEEEAQRRWKRQLLVDALVRIGKFEDPPVEPTESGGPALGYRNRVEFAVARAPATGRVVGLHRAGSDRVVDVRRCLLQDDEAHAILGTIREFLLEGTGATDGAWDDPRREVRIAIRRSLESGRSLVSVRTTGPPPDTLGSLADRLEASHGSIAGVVHLAARPGRRGGTRATVLRGEDRISERMAGTAFSVPAGTFVQVNPRAGALLVDRVFAEVGGARRVVELYGGVGAFGIALSRRGAEVLVVEADGEAVAAGREAASRDALAEIRFLPDRVERAIVRPELVSFAPEVVLADPPRAGMGRAVTGAVADLAPRRVVLVACDPASLARDARTLTERGYRLRRVLPIDLFPQTAHVEAVAGFDRNG